MERPTFYRGCGLRNKSSATYNALLTSLPRHFETISKLASNDGRAGQQLIDESHLESCDHNDIHEWEGVINVSHLKMTHQCAPYLSLKVFNLPGLLNLGVFDRKKLDILSCLKMFHLSFERLIQFTLSQCQGHLACDHYMHTQRGSTTQVTISNV